MNADKDKYGRLVKNFRNDYANQQDNFPVTLMSMRERMYYENKDFSKEDKKHKDKQVTEKKDKSAEKVEFATSFAQIARGKKTCFICGGPHYKNDCPLKDSLPKEKWVINQMNSHFQEARPATQQCLHTTNPRPSSDEGTVASDPVRRNEDIRITENIFGPDMATLKGKSTRPTPKPVLQDWIELPMEIIEYHSEVELCMDDMFIIGVKLMTAIDRTIRFRSVIPTQS